MEDVITAECLLCDGLAYYMGTLGRLDWFRCSSCGAQTSYLAGPEIEFNDEERNDA